MIKRFFLFLICLSIADSVVKAQIRVVDAENNSPVAAASVFDCSGNMVGFTWSDGTLTDIAESAYPITIRCVSYQPVTIPAPEEKVWTMTPAVYDLDELVIVPVERNILKQMFYVREYFSLNTDSDTATFFVEHMADRFISTQKGSRIGGGGELRVLATRTYARFTNDDIDSLIYGAESIFPSLLSLTELNDEPLSEPDIFKQTEGTTKFYEKKSKYGSSVIIRQNGQVFSYMEDVLADKKNHTWSPFPLKMLGYTVNFEKMYTSSVYRVNDTGVYLPKDLNEASFVLEAIGTGKNLRKKFDSDEPVIIRTMVELYVVNHEFLSVKEAKEERRNKPVGVQIVIPESVPPLNKATEMLVEHVTKAAKL